MCEIVIAWNFKIIQGKYLLSAFNLSSIISRLANNTAYFVLDIDKTKLSHINEQWKLEFITNCWKHCRTIDSVISFKITWLIEMCIVYLENLEKFYGDQRKRKAVQWFALNIDRFVDYRKKHWNDTQFKCGACKLKSSHSTVQANRFDLSRNQINYKMWINMPFSCCDNSL